jgi:hypothetical protein
LNLLGQLKPGGRLVANAVTLQSEVTLMNWRERHGGELTRIHVAQAQPLGEFDTWRQALPITLLDLVKPSMRDETAEQPAPLRSGLTTGSCATATSLAAARLLLGGTSAMPCRSSCPRASRCRCAWSSAA